MKKFLICIIATLFAMPLVVNAKDPVKVYLFEAGGCPYCEAEVKYLEELESFNKKFVIVRKESYIDHIDWEPGADYNLAVNVANAFNEVGFEDATYRATPFVIISDIYAASAYNTNLESIIEEAYDKGDKDIVGCIESGDDTCLDHLKVDEKSQGNKDNIITTIVCTIIIILVYLVKSSTDTNKIIDGIGKNEQTKEN